ncbi:MAG: hypothetical protein M0Q91_12130 [Methanoregula sp.]|jgi:hypothetical protein|nr:hypothetical protein [Methanoregula sp.]
MKPVPGIYEVYIGLESWEAIVYFIEKYGYLPDHPQRINNKIFIAGPVKEEKEKTA